MRRPPRSEQGPNVSILVPANLVHYFCPGPLARHTGRGVLRNHAESVLAEVYTEAVERAATETGLSVEIFPGECPYSLEQLLSLDLLSD
jgi:hypothetical protein